MSVISTKIFIKHHYHHNNCHYNSIMNIRMTVNNPVMINAVMEKYEPNDRLRVDEWDDDQGGQGIMMVMRSD